MSYPRLLAALALLVPMLSAPYARAADDVQLALELNKLEPMTPAAGGANGCRAYLVATDPDGGPKVDQLRLDLVLFGTDGVISRRIALDVGPLTPGRMQVRPFELRDVPCESIGQILVNDTIICKIGGADQSDCMDRLKTTTRVPTKLVK